MLPMRRRLSRLLPLACAVLALAACSTRETKEAIAKADGLAAQQHYDEANSALIDALRAREEKIRAQSDDSRDGETTDALRKKIQSDSEILKMERAQIPLYLRLNEADRAAAVFTDIAAGHLGDRALVDLLADKDAKIRTGVVRTLGLVGGADSIDPLVKASTDTDEDVRSEAVSSLGLIQDPRTVKPLIHALNDEYWYVRSQAADALQREKDTSAIGPLLDTVSDPDATVAGSAENALVNICQSPGLTPDTFAAHLDDANPKIAMISAICLAVMHDSRATPILIKMASSTDAQTRLHAVKGLGETADPAVIPTLRQTLHDPEVNVRGWSIIGLDNLKDTGSIDALRAMAADPNETAHIREFASAAVSHLSSQTAPPAPAAK
jgi:HEAT repeat protein